MGLELNNLFQAAIATHQFVLRRPGGNVSHLLEIDECGFRFQDGEIGDSPTEVGLVKLADESNRLAQEARAGGIPTHFDSTIVEFDSAS